MTRASTSAIVLLLGAALIAFSGSALAQSEGLQLGMTGRIAFGVSDYDQGRTRQTGTAATLETDLLGVWRDPRILQFSVRPTLTMGSAPEAEMSNALTGFTGIANILKGSSFPLNLSYSKSTTPAQEANSAGYGGVLPTARLATSSSVFNANWVLRFRNLPTLNLTYRDSDQSSDLADGSHLSDDHASKEFAARLHYSIAGWHSNAWYQDIKTHSEGNTILFSGANSNSTKMDDYGASISKELPLHSVFNLNGEQSETNLIYQDLNGTTTIRDAVASLNSRPSARLNTILQAQYTSDSQSWRTGTNSGSSTPTLVSSTPFDMRSITGSLGYRITSDLWINGSVGQSVSSHQNDSKIWSFGPTYQHRWRTGQIGLAYSHSNLETRAQTLTQQTNPLDPTAPTSPLLTLATLHTRGDNGSMNLNQSLPDRFQLTASAHISHGILEENSTEYPNSGYGWLTSVTRPLGEFTLTGSLAHERISTTQSFISNSSNATTVSADVGFRGLSVSVAHQNASGLALQLDGQLLWVTNPASTSLGIATHSNASSTTATGSYRSRTGRWLVSGNFGTFAYGTDLMPESRYRIMNLRTSYKLRKLRLVAGFAKQSQLSTTPTNVPFGSRVIFFQIERQLQIF